MLQDQILGLQDLSEGLSVRIFADSCTPLERCAEHGKTILPTRHIPQLALTADSKERLQWNAPEDDGKTTISIKKQSLQPCNTYRQLQAQIQPRGNGPLYVR